MWAVQNIDWLWVVENSSCILLKTSIGHSVFAIQLWSSVNIQFKWVFLTSVQTVKNFLHCYGQYHYFCDLKCHQHAVCNGVQTGSIQTLISEAGLVRFSVIETAFCLNIFEVNCHVLKQTFNPFLLTVSGVPNLSKPAATFTLSCYFRAYQLFMRKMYWSFLKIY